MGKNYKIYNENKLVAEAIKLDYGVFMIAVEGVSQFELPISLFGWCKRKVDMISFIKWASERCFPEDRVDADKHLKDLGLDRYDGWEIVKFTNAKMPPDPFWVDFGQGEVNK